MSSLLDQSLEYVAHIVEGLRVRNKLDSSFAQFQQLVKDGERQARNAQRVNHGVHPQYDTPSVDGVGPCTS